MHLKDNCQCARIENKGDYVIVTDNQININCTTGLISSATVEQMKSITKYLNETEQLPPYTIK